ncbi:restriction endonuclease subunit S [Psychrobacter immobilis]|uniref:restriction endonuclease subunit S n=1 Tax=Psychrobacter immobilis TaxID=498 RepID=UPI0019186ACF|nr:restriction endonuclease subunit S [Psychrobacter immobilis]
MFYRKISVDSLNTKRLDSDFYRPEYLVIDEVLSHLNCVKLGSIGHFFTGPFGSKLPSSLYVEEGIPLFRVTNVGQFEVITESFVHLSPKSHEELKASEVLPSDLLIVKASVGEKICKVPESLPKANITQHIIAVRPKSHIDIDYISTFLFSYYGVGQLQRYSLGSIIQYLGVTDTKNVNLYYPHLVAQKYIGDKVRQAEQLRAWAKELESEIEQVLNTSEYLVACNTPDTKISHPTLNDLSNRLDPKYYDSKAIAVERFTKKSGTLLGSLIKSIANGFEERNFVNEGVPYITVTEVSSGRLNVQDAPQIGSDISIPSKAIIHERCVLVVRTGSIGTAIKVNILDKGCVISSHLIRLEFEEEETAAAVSVFLNSTAGKILLHKISYGAVQPQIGQEELLALYIPDYVLNKKTTCLTLLENYELTTRASKSLIRTAKTLVEALIEGQLTEEQLIKAQQALEDGDNTLDKAILSKLSNEGYAIEGATPLFSDIDELYRLLASATAADSED